MTSIAFDMDTSVRVPQAQCSVLEKTGLNLRFRA